MYMNCSKSFYRWAFHAQLLPTEFVISFKNINIKIQSAQMYTCVDLFPATQSSCAHTKVRKLVSIMILCKYWQSTRTQAYTYIQTYIHTYIQTHVRIKRGIMSLASARGWKVVQLIDSNKNKAVNRELKLWIDLYVQSKKPYQPEFFP